MRVPRRWRDRLRSLWSPVRRYRCLNTTCGWCGLLPVDETPATADPAAGSGH